VDTCWAEATSCRSGIGQSDKTAQAQKTPYVWKISLPLMHELMSTNKQGGYYRFIASWPWPTSVRAPW